eukprot:TRINITY_DN3576_c0_g1_i2.p1 TRINITY_DN3576_c0_g1~~TRINITY_DN3576_c0_g1_i2.p1  ORF type:complete len:1202 (+),score=347.37 TRINITY_DN3576_c0_g1_i2:247-3852(+)
MEKRSLASNGLHMHHEARARAHNEREITFKNVLKIIFSLAFMRYVILTFFLCGAISLTYLVNLEFFRFIITFFISTTTLMIFTVFSLSQTRIVSGFFMTVGFGYGFVGLFTILQRAAFPLMYIGSEGNYSDIAIQVWVCARYIEIISFVVGIIFVKRTFSGLKMRIIVLLVFLLLSTLMCLSIFLRFFPTCYDEVKNESTNFHKATEGAFVFAFLTIGVMFTIRRRSFHINVYCFLLVALFFRIVSCIMNYTIYDWSGSAVAVLTLIFRAISFLFIFISMGISTLQNPVETLFRNLIDKQAALENERMFSEWMIEQFPTIVVLLDSTGKITHVNNYSLELLQLSKNDVLAQDFFELFTNTENRTAHRGKFEEIISSKSADNNIFTLQAYYPKQNKVIDWTCKSLNFQNSATPRSHSSSSISLSFGKGRDENPKVITLEMEPVERKDEKIIVLCLGQDSTERRQRENLLLQARNEAEKLSLLKDTFVANVSHELRTPLNCIVGVTSLLLQTKLLAQQQEMVEMITTASNSLVAVINDLLDFSSIQQGKLKIIYSQLNLRKFVEEVIVSISVLYQASALDFGFRVEKDCADLIYTDEKRVRQILMNLLSNAIKFTQKGQVVVTVEKSKETLNNSTALLFKVVDSGIGIKESDKDKLFERFSQIEHNYTRKFQGTGIGLTLCKELVQLLGGKIGLESQFGAGSTFWFVLPTQGMDVPMSPKSPLNKKRLSYSFISPVNMKDSYRNQKVYLQLQNPAISKLLYDTLVCDYGFNVKEIDNVKDLNEAIRKYAGKIQGKIKQGKGKVSSESEKTANALSPQSPRKDREISLLTPQLSRKEKKEREAQTPQSSRKAKDATALSTSVKMNELSTSVKLSEIPLVEHSKSGKILSIVFETSDLDELDVATLRKIQESKVEVHILIISPNIANNFVNYDFAAVGIPIDIIGKPIRNSLLVQHLHRKKRRASLSAQMAITESPSNMHMSFHSISTDSASTDPKEDLTEPTKILLVEDNVTNQKVIMMLLKRIGNIEHEVANNGREAVDKFTAGNFDLILMDCQMPIMDGYTATTEIRRIEQERLIEMAAAEGSKVIEGPTESEESEMSGDVDSSGEGSVSLIQSSSGILRKIPHIPIIALTANAMEADRDKCLKIGMDDYLTKPIILDTLRKKLEYWQEIRRHPELSLSRRDSENVPVETARLTMSNLVRDE